MRVEYAGIGGLLARASARYPEHTALRHGTKAWSYAAVHDLVRRIAGGLVAAGLRRGDRVGVISWNSPELLVTMLAAFHAGLCVVPVNARSTVQEAKSVLSDADVAAVVHGAEYADHAAAVPGKPIIIAADCDSDAPWSLGGLADSAEPLPGISVRPDAPAWLFYTSGTTGTPKGAVLTHRNLQAMVLAYLADVRDTHHSHVVVHAAPLTHGSGLYALPAIARGATQVLATSRSYDPGEVLRLIREYEATDIAFLTPTMVKRLTEEASTVDVPPSLQHVVYGGAPMYVDDLVAAMDRFGPIFSQIYGQAEAPVTISTMPAAEHARAVAENPTLLASAGHPYTNSEVAVCTESRDVLPYGEGEILTRGEVVMAGYWRNPEATAAALDGGWLHTGDLGKVDPDGRLWLLDRSKDVIITGGSNVYPREVEDVLADHPAVRQVAVVGAPDREWGERVVAVVVLHPGYDEQQITQTLDQHCRKVLAGYKVPRQFDFRDHLPTSSYGKVLKRELRAEYWRNEQRRI